MTVITQLPDPPSRTTPSQFSTRTDAFLGALPGFVTETNAVASEVNADKTTAVNSAVIAVTKAAEATASASTAAIVGTSTKWISGTTYTEGQGVWSPVDFLPYRRLTNGVGTLDPSVDSVNWEPLPPVPMVRVERSSNVEINPADRGHFFDITSGTFSQTFSSKEILGNGFYCYILNSGAGVVTIDPGGLNYALYKKHSLLIHCDGTSLRVVVDSGPRQVRLPILSAETVGRDANSTGESMTVDMLIPTGLSAALYTAAGYHAASGLFWAVSIGGASANIATSPDGVTWTLRAMPASATWRIVETSTGLLAFAAGGTATAYSNNGGVLWSSKTVLPGNANSSGTCFAAAVGGRVAIASASTTLYYSDNDGGTWASYTLPASITNLWSMGGLFGFYNNGASDTYYTSPTGETWTTRTFPVTGFAPAQCSDRVALYASTGTTQYESTDNINWAENGALKSAIFRTDGGVGAYFSATFGESFTLHKPRVPVFRTAQVPDVATYGYGQSGSLSVIGTSGGKIIRVDETATDATGLFEV